MCEQNHLPRRPAIPVVLYALVAVLVSEQVTLRGGAGWVGDAAGVTLAIACALLLAVAAMGIMRSWPVAGMLAVLCAGLAVGWVLASFALMGRDAFVDAASHAAVSGWDMRIASEPKESGDAYRCRATAMLPGSVCGDVWLTLPRRENLGTTLRCVGRFEPNKDDEWGVSSRLQGVWGTVRAVRMVQRSPAEGFYGLVMRLRERVVSCLAPESSPERALIASCACGCRVGLSAYGLDETFSRCGLSHLVAVSGSHLALFSSLLGTLLEKARMRRFWRVLMLVVACGTYVLFCGVPSSAVRAWVMASMAMLAGLAGRRSHALTGACIAGLAMALLEPTASGQVGFLLSLSSVCGLCLFSAYASYAIGSIVGRHALPRWVPRPAARRLAGFATALRESFAASMVAQVATLPIVVATFGEMSLVGPIVNPLVSIPFTVMTCLGMIAMVATPLPPAQGVLLFLAEMAAKCVVGVAQSFSRLPMCTMTFNKSELLPSLLICLAAVALLAVWPHVNRAKVAIAFSVVVGIVIADVVRWRYFAPARVCVLDVGQGDSILVQDGASSILVDTGPDESVALALRRNHVTHLDAVVITHLHDDHYAGLAELVGHVSCDHVYVGRGMAQNVPDVMAGACKSLTGNAIEEIAYGDVLHVDGFALRMVWPHEEVGGTQNEDSVMLCLSYAENGRTLDGLLTGDAEKEEEQAVLDSHDVGNIDFLKAGHHGSSESVTSDLATDLDPEVCVASAGAKNRYGHPTKECREALEGCGCLFLCTKDKGDVEIRPGKVGPEVLCAKSDGM